MTRQADRPDLRYLLASGCREVDTNDLWATAEDADMMVAELDRLLAEAAEAAAPAEPAPLVVPVTELGEVLAHTIRGECINDEEHYFCGLCDVDVTKSSAFHEKGCEYSIVRAWLRALLARSAAAEEQQR